MCCCDSAQPDPIMKLSHVVGMSGSRTGSLLWSATGEELIYPCKDLVVVMSVTEDEGNSGSGSGSAKARGGIDVSAMTGTGNSYGKRLTHSSTVLCSLHL